MMTLLKLEHLGITVLAVYVLLNINSNPLFVMVTLFLPDLFALGYLVNAKVGSLTYNLAHHQGVAALLIILGHLLGIGNLIYAGLVIFAHSSFDRLLGYGLKYSNGFKHTHLGKIGI